MEENYICKFCSKVCKNANSLRNHERLCKLNPNHQETYFKTHLPWNKGLTKETNETLKKSGENFSAKVKNGEIVLAKIYLGKHLSEEHKNAIARGMKKAHAENRAHNIGESRWNTEHSWPEKWFIQVLSNEFQMKESEHYVTEMPFCKYSLDFAWPEKKLCIEIDGEQHERFEEYKQRDIKKDKLLLANEWQVIRINWKDCCNNPKETINLVRNKFIELQLF